MTEATDGSHEYLTLNEVHQELLKLLLCFDAFCKEHGLRYSLDSGTLLGAVRHKGFIPWDDDIDLSMPRPDYDKLLSIEKELPSSLMIVSAFNSNFTGGYCKLCTPSIHAQELSYEGVIEEMLWIDIFPMDGMSDDLTLSKKAWRRAQRALRCNEWANINLSYEQGLRRVIKTFCGHLFRLGNPREQMLRVINEVTSNPGYSSAERVGCFVGNEGKFWTVSKDGYEKTTDMEFEGYMLPCMSCWDDFLTALYGDYMKLPPEDQRRTHCIKAWRV